VTAPAPSDVNAVAISPPVRIVAQNSGPAGAQGSAGAAGPTGPQGPAGEVELVTCTKVKGKNKCRTQLTSSPQTFTTKAARASVSRAGHVYATGSLHDGRLTLHAASGLRAGHYTLTLTTGTGANKHITKKSLTVAKTITIA